MDKSKNQFLFNVLIFIAYLSFLLGFYFDENSAGAGKLTGDISWIVGNIKIFENNDLLTAIAHPDYYGNRPPLVYILHNFFNPFLYNIEHYRISVFCISLLGPIVFYYCLKQRFKNIDKKLLILISSFILLSPYYRTSSYWALNENYGLISVLLSFLFLQYFLDSIKNNHISFLKLFFTILFSSLCVYFDQKFLVVPIVCLLNILSSKINNKYKIYTLAGYFILSLPFLYLVLFLWNGVVPPLTREVNPRAITSISTLNNFYLHHIGYATTMISLYILPLLFFKNKDFFLLIKDFFTIRINYFKILPCLIYIFCLFFFFDFKDYTVDNYWIGFGYIHKISLLFNSLLFQEFFTYLAFLVSWIIILIYIDKDTKDLLFIFYFYFFSLAIWPLMQEYFDPIILLLCFVALKTRIYINKKNTIFLFSYLSVFLVGANIYYFFKLS